MNGNENGHWDGSDRRQEQRAEHPGRRSEDPHGDDNGFRAMTPWLSLSARGPLAVIILVVIAAAAVIVFMVDRQTQTFAAALDRQTVEYRSVIATMSELACLLATDQASRRQALIEDWCADYATRRMNGGKK